MNIFWIFDSNEHKKHEFWYHFISIFSTNVEKSNGGCEFILYFAGKNESCTFSNCLFFRSSYNNQSIHFDEDSLEWSNWIKSSISLKTIRTFIEISRNIIFYSSTFCQQRPLTEFNTKRYEILHSIFLGMNDVKP